VWSHYSRRAVERARDLTLDRFIERAFQLLEKIL
jgi:hypothetical protein